MDSIFVFSLEIAYVCYIPLFVFNVLLLLTVDIKLNGYCFVGSSIIPKLRGLFIWGSALSFAIGVYSSKD